MNGYGKTVNMLFLATMKRLYMVAAVIPFLLILQGAQADWISDVDKHYSTKNPILFAKVFTAKHLLSNAQGMCAESDMDEASRLLTDVLQADPLFAPVYVQLARWVSNGGDARKRPNRSMAERHQEQEGYLNKALSIEPQYDYALAMMGYTKMFQGELDAAQMYYTKANELNSKYPFLKSQMAQLYIRLGQYNKAIKLASEGLKYYGHDQRIAAALVVELINAYEKLDGDNTSSLERWHKELQRLAPEEPTTWTWHANFRLHRLGDYETAIKSGERSLQYGGGRILQARVDLATAYYAKWATLYAEAPTSGEAEEAFQTALSYWHPSEDMLRNMKNNKMLKAAGEALLTEAKKRNIQVFRTITGRDGMTIYLKNDEK